MKRTVKSKSNSRQKSTANGRQDKSRANGRQSNRRTATETKAKHEEKHRKVQGEAQCKARLRQPASPEASWKRCRCPAGAGRSDHDHSKDRLEPDRSEAAAQVQKIVKGCHSEEDCTMTVSSAARRLHDEIQRNPDGQGATFSNRRTENKTQNVFDSESRSDWSFTVQKDTEVIHREVNKEEQRSIVT